MAIRQRNQAVVVAKLQSALDSWPTFDYATDALDVLATPTIRFVTERVARENIKRTLGATGELVTSMYCEVTFRVEMKGGGVSGSEVVEPRIGRLIQACGFKHTTEDDGAGNIIRHIYTPSSAEFGTSDRPAIALELYMGMSGNQADRFQIINAGGNFRFTGSVGQYGVVEFTFTGQLYNGPTTVTVPDVTYETTQPKPFLSANLTFDGINTFVFNSFTLDTGNSVIIRRDVNSNTGIKGILLGRRNITVSLDPEATFASTYDWYGKLREGAKASIAVGPVGSDTGNKYLMEAPSAQFTEVADSDRDEIMTHDVSLLLTEVNGDDELTIKFE